MEQNDADERNVTNDWRLLISRKEEFLKILSLLVDFDTRTGRAARYADPQTHYMRKAIAVAGPSLISVFLRRTSADLYSLVAQMHCDSGFLVTAFVLEDGIHQERATQPSDHPTHKIVCMTDLFHNDCEPVGPIDNLNPITQTLLSEVAIVATQ